MDERRLIGRLCAVAGIVFFGYALCGSTAQSLFLATYGKAGLPAGYLAVGLTSVVCSAGLSGLARRMEIVALFRWTSWAALAVLTVLLVAAYRDMAGARFGLFVWKEIYVVLLGELFWTLANSHFDFRHAKNLYGLFCAAGSLGAITGNLLLGPLAPRLGSLSLLAATVPCLILPPLIMPPGHATMRAAPELRGSLRVLFGSRTLLLILGIVGSVQIVMTLTDYQFNARLADVYPDADVRTGVLGTVNAAINAVALLLQLATGLLVARLGLRRLLWGIPALLCVVQAVALGMPGFAGVAAVKILGKSSDYSLIRATKEMLYLPLTYGEKTQGKALADMLVYRLAKAAAAALLLVVASPADGNVIGFACVGTGAVWCGLAVAASRGAGAAAEEAPKEPPSG